jgi:hypothetical protein
MPASSSIRSYRFGPKNKKLANPDGSVTPTAYQLLVDYDLPLATLLERNEIDLAPDAGLITPDHFPSDHTGRAHGEFELFDFSFRSDYGRSGVDEAFIRDKFEMTKYRAATLVELLCFGGHFRELYRDHWFEARNIIALGSVLETTEVVRKKSWFHKEVLGIRRNYPELQCVAGRPRDLLTLSTTERDQDGNWPNATLFLAVPIF